MATKDFMLILFGLMLGSILTICVYEFLREHKIKNKTQLNIKTNNPMELIPVASENFVQYPKKTGIRAAEQLAETLKLAKNRRHSQFIFNENSELFAGIAEYVRDHQKELEDKGYKITYSSEAVYGRSHEYNKNDYSVEIDW